MILLTKFLLLTTKNKVMRIYIEYTHLRNGQNIFKAMGHGRSGTYTKL